MSNLQNVINKQKEELITEFKELLKDYKIIIEDAFPNSEPQDIVERFIIRKFSQSQSEIIEVVREEEREKSIGAYKFIEAVMDGVKPEEAFEKYCK